MQRTKCPVLPPIRGPNGTLQRHISHFSATGGKIRDHYDPGWGAKPRGGSCLKERCRSSISRAQLSSMSVDKCELAGSHKSTHAGVPVYTKIEAYEKHATAARENPDPAKTWLIRFSWKRKRRTGWWRWRRLQVPTRHKGASATRRDERER